MMPQDDSVYATRIDDLRDFEREYRERLRMHLEDCLGTLDAREDSLPLRAAARRLSEAPEAGLREVFADLPEDRRQHLLSVLLRVPVPEVTA
jgi:hypothetical protein